MNHHITNLTFDVTFDDLNQRVTVASTLIGMFEDLNYGQTGRETYRGFDQQLAHDCEHPGETHWCTHWKTQPNDTVAVSTHTRRHNLITL